MNYDNLSRDELINILKSRNTNTSVTSFDKSGEQCKFKPLRKGQQPCQEQAYEYGFCRQHCRSVQAKNAMKEHRLQQSKNSQPTSASDNSINRVDNSDTRDIKVDLKDSDSESEIQAIIQPDTSLTKSESIDVPQNDKISQDLPKIIESTKVQTSNDIPQSNIVTQTIADTPIHESLNKGNMYSSGLGGNTHSTPFTNDMNRQIPKPMNTRYDNRNYDIGRIIREMESESQSKKLSQQKNNYRRNNLNDNHENLDSHDTRTSHEIQDKNNTDTGLKTKRKKIYQNKWGRYEDPDTKIVFDHKTKAAYGVQDHKTGAVHELSKYHITVCKRNGWGYQLCEDTESDTNSQETGSENSQEPEYLSDSDTSKKDYDQDDQDEDEDEANDNDNDETNSQRSDDTQNTDDL